MKKVHALISVFLFVFSVAAVSFAAEEQAGMPDQAFSIARMVIAGSIEDREPVGVVNAYSASTEKVFCFLETGDVKSETMVSFVWYHGDTKKAAVELPLGISPRWRTYSSKKLGGLTGEWKVELHDSGGSVLKTVSFTVE
jgi:hypothetical protein